MTMLVVCCASCDCVAGYVVAIDADLVSLGFG